MERKDKNKKEKLEAIEQMMSRVRRIDGTKKRFEAVIILKR